jgi:hypothetical protein
VADQRARLVRDSSAVGTDALRSSRMVGMIAMAVSVKDAQYAKANASASAGATSARFAGDRAARAESPSCGAPALIARSSTMARTAVPTEAPIRFIVWITAVARGMASRDSITYAAAVIGPMTAPWPNPIMNSAPAMAVYGV